MDGLAERIVVALDKNEKFRLKPFHICGGLAIQWTVGINRVDDSPGERKIVHTIAFQSQPVVASCKRSSRPIHGHEQNAGVEFHQHVRPEIYDSKLKARAVLVRRHQHLVAESDSGRRPRNPSEKKTRRNSETHQADHCFKRRYRIGCRATGGQVSISHRRQRVSTEKEGAEESPEVVLYVVTLKGVRTDEVIDTSKQRVHQKVTCKYQTQERRPSDIDDVQIWMDVSPVRPAAPDVEASVLVDRAPQNTADLLCKARVKSGFAHFNVFSSRSSVRMAGRTCSMLDFGSRRS